MPHASPMSLAKLARITVLMAGLLAPCTALPPAHFTFAVISDVHMDLRKLGLAFRDMKARRVDTAVVVGDTCDGQQKEYDSLRTFLAEKPHPQRLFFTMGNHEYYAAYHPGGGDYDEAGFPNGETSAACRERFNRFRGAGAGDPVYHDAWVEGLHFIFLAGERSRMDDPAFLDDAVLTGAQLSWLEAHLAETPVPGAPVFVFLHQPFQDTVSGSGGRGDGSLSIRQGTALEGILAAHPGVFFFSGHTHWRLALPTTHRAGAAPGLQLFNTSSVRDPYTSADEPVKHAMSEGLTVTVTRNRVVVTARDFLGRRDLPGQRYEFRLPSPRKTGGFSPSAAAGGAGAGR